MINLTLAQENSIKEQMIANYGATGKFSFCVSATIKYIIVSFSTSFGRIEIEAGFSKKGELCLPELLSDESGEYYALVPVKL